MDYNYIGIDTSLSSTGMYIRMINGTEHFFNYRNNSKLSKWHKTLSYVNYYDYENVTIDNYSDQELAKLIQYTKVTDKIVSDILTHVKPEETIIVTEGYSYSSSNTSSLIDLIGYATLLRIKLINLPFNEILIKSPSTLKLDTCKISYPAIEKKIGGKNPRTEYIYKNDQGISGGRFTKHEMLKSLFDCPMINSRIKESLDIHKIDLLKMRQIPKPIDDIVDAQLLAMTEYILRNI